MRQETKHFGQFGSISMKTVTVESAIYRKGIFLSNLSQFRKNLATCLKVSSYFSQFLSVPMDLGAEVSEKKY